MIKNKFAAISDRNINWIIFFSFLLVRALYTILSPANNFVLQPDSIRYQSESDGILNGNYMMKTYLFIVAPAYPFIMASFKYIFGLNWIYALEIFQILISSLSGIFLYKAAKIIFTKPVAIISAIIYCVYPLTFWWVFTFGQECFFQSMLIISIYFLLAGTYENNFKQIIISAVFFSCTFLTKSHILFFAPFIPIFFLLNFGFNIKFIKFSAAFGIICLLFTIPYGLYHLKNSGLYVISSTGYGGHFITGHNDDAYELAMNPPKPGTPEYQKLVMLDYKAINDLQDSIVKLKHADQQKLYLSEGLKWCRENPKRFLKISWSYFISTVRPGIARNSYSFSQWLLTLIFSSFVYLFGYAGMLFCLYRNFKKHFWILGLFLSIVIFSVGFYIQKRFVIITIEPFYIIYASFSIWIALKKIAPRIFNKA